MQGAFANPALRPALRTPNELYTLEVAEDPPFFTNNQRGLAWDAEVHSVSPAGGPVSGNTTVHIHGWLTPDGQPLQCRFATSRRRRR